LGNTTRRTTPTKVTGLANVMQLAAGDSHSLALHNDGTVSAFGSNSNGQ
jgi:alpha-tubulin suppressor-like RCC1 family protein